LLLLHLNGGFYLVRTSTLQTGSDGGLEIGIGTDACNVGTAKPMLYDKREQKKSSGSTRRTFQDSCCLKDSVQYKSPDSPKSLGRERTRW